MNDCLECTRAKAEPWHVFNRACPGCRARAISRSPTFFDARKAGTQSLAYRNMLAVAEVAHDDVKAWHDIDAIRNDNQGEP